MPILTRCITEDAYIYSFQWDQKFKMQRTLKNK